MLPYRGRTGGEPEGAGRPEDKIEYARILKAQGESLVQIAAKTKIPKTSLHCYRATATAKRKRHASMSAHEQDDPGCVPELAWWLDDPELWKLLEFEGQHDADGLPVDLRRKDRQRLLEDLIRLPGLVDIDFARFLLSQETQWHGHAWGFSHTIEIAALLVAEHRRAQDIGSYGKRSSEASTPGVASSRTPCCSLLRPSARSST
ncbi:hypothetical protein ABZ348_30355 [Streptomyces sp. NPDC005963]|uniref:hypothetical protein n=1 Tax=Streptomyces sp. NPDC005963 TaxID=3156721 RepID=UPI0033E5BE10